MFAELRGADYYLSGYSRIVLAFRKIIPDKAEYERVRKSLVDADSERIRREDKHVSFLKFRYESGASDRYKI